MKFIISLCWFVAIFVLLGVGILFACAITGYDKRSYHVLQPDQAVKVGDLTQTVEELATDYRPKAFLRRTTPSPPLLWIWYEAVPTPNGIDLIYYLVWENEIHPDPILHKLYILFRAAYYGYPLYDIEYFQIGVSRTDGTVSRLRFETSPGDNYFSTLSEHVVVLLQRRDDGTYDEIRTTQRGRELSRSSGITAQFDGRRVLIAVQTWNHLTRLLTPEDKERDFSPLPEVPLKYLSEAEYARFKFVRKSQGDHRTEESKWTLPVAILASLFFLALPAKLFNRFLQRSSQSGRFRC
jgi:hypothetical protein